MDGDWPAERFAADRPRSQAVADRLLGSASEADDAVQGAATAELTRQRAVVDAFLAAARNGDFDALLAVLDPDVVLRNDRAVVAAGAASEVRGAAAVARRAAAVGARAAQSALVNGAVGVIVAPRGRLMMVLDFTIADGTIVAIDAIADPARLRRLELAMLGD